MDAVLIIAAIASIYFAGRLAERRGRSFKVWAWIAAFVGPLAFVVFLLPNRRSRTGGQA
jgi:MFS family permease